MAEFAVWAPNADSVAVVTDCRDAVDLTPGDDGHWRGQLDLAPGTEYLLRVRRGDDEWLRIDPRARQVTNSVGRAVVTEPFGEWTDDGFVARPLNEWVIYELHPGTFGDGLTGVADHLDHLVNLGVTVIELMPVAEFAGDQSWGYNPAFPFAVESSYGGPEALCRLVDAAHARGLTVVLDVVYNHFGPSDLDLWRFDGWFEGEGGGIWFYNDWRAQTPWGATRPDYGRPEVRAYLLDNARMWLGEYHLDGLRLDSTINIRNGHGTAGPDGDLDDGWAFLAELTSTIAAEFPSAVLIAEDLMDDPRVTVPVAEGGLGFHLQWSAQFVHHVREVLTTPADELRDLDAVVAAVIGGADAFTRVVYVESHDEVANGSTRVPTEVDGEAPDSLHAFRRAALGAVLTMTAAGVPMMFQGQEWFDKDWFDDSRPLRWDRVDERSGVISLLRDLIRLRTGDDPRALGLRGDQVDAYARDGHVFVRRWGLGGEKSAVCAVLNLSAQDDAEVELPANEGDGWECVLATDWTGYHPSGADTRLAVERGAVRLPAYGAAVLVPR